jgi:hypothetical protein
MQAGVDGAALDPEAESALAKVEKLPAPLAALAPFLRGLASGALPAVPADLPDLLTEVLTGIREAVQQARGSG